MNDIEYKQKISEALQRFQSDELSKNAVHLLGVLGYRSDNQIDLDSNHPDAFFAEYDQQGTLNRDKLLSADWNSIDLLFQLTGDDLTLSNQRGWRFDSSVKQVDNTIIESYLFFAIRLRDSTYNRTQLSQITREINKLFPMPVMLLLQHGQTLTFSIIDRRLHKRDESRDVLEKVTLIKDIDFSDPHRAHIEILFDLALEQLHKTHDVHNFVELHHAWEKTLDIEELNRQFYLKLFDWFEWAVSEAKFPSILSIEQHVIRLITRILFVWFIKEKHLVAKEWFVRSEMDELLKNFGQSDYYRAILQNLFFATLNTEMKHRQFSPQKRRGHRMFSQYRYRSLIAYETRFMALMKQTPFINGGLFDCLDSEEATRDGGYRIDMFSDPDPIEYPAARRKAWQELHVPDDLFFHEQRGLFPLLKHYKFTVEENTPIEQEVALDPELLGKVFENLLAAYNPETRETARKQTGSYYTPRPVVDYMVNETLMATLAKKCQPIDGDMAYWQERLRYLLNYESIFDDANELFEKEEAVGIVRAIAEIKVLDPAVGSGAFPMGILHTLTLVLQRLDPDNKRWEALQKERARAKADAAFETKDHQERDAELLEISETFEQYSGDFGRKLYLIQNSIFGVDIQPIACQIAKLRFFISLAIEQEADENADNFGIKPLPNLETRFVAADTLLRIQEADQLDLFRQQIETLKTKLLENNERHFHATTRQKKLVCKTEDKRLRTELAQELLAAGLPQDDAHKIAQWDRYDQNAKADWFDPEYMFGMTRGFDVVIGNPPYIQLKKNRGELRRRYQDADFETFAATGDIYQLFYEKGCQQLIPQRGLLAYITSNSWLKAQYGKSTRRYLAEQHTPLRLLEMGKGIFENAIVDTNILIVRNDKSNEIGKAIDMDRLPNKNFPPVEDLWGELRPHGENPWCALSATERSIMDKMEAVGTPLKEWDISINYGIKTGYNTAFIIDNPTKDMLITQDANSAEIIKPILRGRDIKRYEANWAGLWLIDSHNGYDNIPPIDIEDYPAIKSYLDKFYTRLEKRQDKGVTPYNLRNCAYHEVFKKEKLFWMHLSPSGRFTYSDSETIFCNQKAFVVTGNSLKYLCAILNSHLVTWQIKNIAVTTGMGLTQWDKFVVECLPVPKISTANQRAFTDLVDEILKAKASNPIANTDEQEVEIDRLVYALYGLTEKEISAITLRDKIRSN